MKIPWAALEFLQMDIQIWASWIVFPRTSYQGESVNFIASLNTAALSPNEPASRGHRVTAAVLRDTVTGTVLNYTY